MALTLLFAGKFDEYFAHYGSGNPLWLFVHVPKTAGSSLRQELAEMLQPEANVAVDYHDASLPHDEKMDSAARRFIAANRALAHRFASGHILDRHACWIEQAAADVRRVTMLRDPVARFVSDYRYQRSPMHPTHQEFKKRVPNLADYAAMPGEWNKMARHLVPAELLQAEDASGAVAYLMERYTFVGLQEIYALSFAVLTRLLGTQRKATVRLRVNAVTEETKVEFTPELRQQVEAANRLDIAIYEAFLARWRAVEEALADFMAQGAPSTAAA